MVPQYLKDRLSPAHVMLLGQLVRYGISGLFVTALHQAMYLGMAEGRGMSPQLSNIVATLIATLVGYIIHSQWSFKDHGGRDGHARMGIRFVTVTLFGFLLNSIWIWLFHDLLQGEDWWPSPAMAILTPLAVFWLNRKWVFA